MGCQSAPARKAVRGSKAEFRQHSIPQIERGKRNAGKNASRCAACDHSSDQPAAAAAPEATTGLSVWQRLSVSVAWSHQWQQKKAYPTNWLFTTNIIVRQDVRQCNVIAVPGLWAG